MQYSCIPASFRFACLLALLRADQRGTTGMSFHLDIRFIWLYSLVPVCLWSHVSEQHMYINFLGQYLKLEQPLQKCQLGWLGQAETV